MQVYIVWCVALALLQNSICCRKYKECQGIKEPDVVVASKKSCAKYIFCNGINSYEGECLTGNHFNENTGTCEEPIKVKCTIKPNPNVQSIFNMSFVTKETEQQTKNNMLSSTTQAIYKEIDFGENKVNTSDTESTTHHHNPTCSPLTGFHNIKNIANPASCETFYTCYNGHAISMLCPTKMYFNEHSGKCEQQIPESCKAKYSARLNCYKGVYDFVPHPTRCEYYYYCVNGHLMIMRCPDDFTWHYERGTCVHKSKSKCLNRKTVLYQSDKAKQSV